MTVKPVAIVLSAIAVLLAGASARAHLRLDSPTPRWPDDPDVVYVKNSPCGMENGAPGPSMATFTAGEMIAVQWTETVNHPGHYRISLTDQGDAAFVDPADYDDLYPADNVLMDDIEDLQQGAPTPYMTMVQIPQDISCDACVLQVIQVMTDKAPYGDGDDIYYQCADITILPFGGGSTGGGEGTGGTAESSDGGAGDSSGGPNDSGPADEGSTGGGSGEGGDDLGSAGSTGALSSSGSGGDDDKGSGCGCRTGDSAGWGLALFAVVALRRRARPARSRAS